MEARIWRTGVGEGWLDHKSCMALGGFGTMDTFASGDDLIRGAGLQDLEAGEFMPGMNMDKGMDSISSCVVLLSAQGYTLTT